MNSWPSRRRSGAGARLQCGPVETGWNPAPPRRANRSAGVFRVHLADGGRIIVDVVVVEIAGELGGVLVFEAALEPAPRRIAQLLATFLRGVQVFRESIEIDFAGRLEGNFFFLFVELF